MTSTGSRPNPPASPIAMPGDEFNATIITLVKCASLQVVPSVIKTVTWDCSDALALATFWAAALGSEGGGRRSR